MSCYDNSNIEYTQVIKGGINSQDLTGNSPFKFSTKSPWVGTITGDASTLTGVLCNNGNCENITIIGEATLVGIQLEYTCILPTIVGYTSAPIIVSNNKSNASFKFIITLTKWCGNNKEYNLSLSTK